VLRKVRVVVVLKKLRVAAPKKLRAAAPKKLRIAALKKLRVAALKKLRVAALQKPSPAAREKPAYLAPPSLVAAGKQALGPNKLLITAGDNKLPAKRDLRNKNRQKLNFRSIVQTVYLKPRPGAFAGKDLEKHKIH